MENGLKYMPVFRLRQQEKNVLTSFDFGDNIFPCVEIIKELERVPRKPSEKSSKTKKKLKPQKTFEGTWIPILCQIKAKKVIVDLPVNMKQNSRVAKEVLSFLRGVTTKREVRTDYLRKLWTIADKIIPVISTFSQQGELNSITTQVNDLRPIFKSLAFRTSEKTIGSDMLQIQSVAQSQDYLIIDLEDNIPSPTDDLIIQPLLEKIGNFNNCPVIILRNAVVNSIKNKNLNHGQIIEEIDNSLVQNYSLLKGSAFGDYAGIKKDDVQKGGGKVSPGFIFYDALHNQFYGYRGADDDDDKSLDDFENIIVPAVLNSTIVAHMRASSLGFLDSDNKGWAIINNIRARGESGKSPGKFKRISMEHYLHCIKRMLSNSQLLQQA